MGMRRADWSHVIGGRPDRRRGPGGKIVPGRSKYNNRRTEVDGIVFDSRHEANFYASVVVPGVRAGSIVRWERQKRYTLVDDRDKQFRIVYVADFVLWWKDNPDVPDIVDAKGFRTDVYRIKRILMWKLLGLTIREV